MTSTTDSSTVTLADDEQSAKTPMLGCRACGAMQPAGFRFCRICGAPFTRGDLPHGFMDPLVGAVVGDRYRILARIGSGGMGAVYRVEHVQIGKVAAMKLLHGELSRDQAMVRRFNREARAVSKLTSPHTVSVFDYGRSAGLVYIVMELLGGRDLSKVLRDEGALEAERVANMVTQVSHSLAEAHELGITHRDLKPQNIFLLDDGNEGPERFKVLDFGLAKLAEAREESLSVDETQAGVVMGTPHYMSPEQIRDRHVDHRSDVYSLGAVVYRLLTGDPPFQHKTPLGVLHMHLNEPVPALADRDPKLAPLDRVLRRAMAKSPDARYGSVTEFAEDLAATSATASGSGSRQRIRITSGPDAVDPRRIGTRHEFEVYERRLKLRRGFSVVMTSVTALVGAAILYLSWSGQLSTGRRSEAEPNDDLRSATTVRSGAAVTGTISAKQNAVDVDVFRVANPSPGAYLSARLVPEAGIDVSLEVVDSNGQLLLRSDSGGPGEEELVPNLAVPGAEVFLMVHGRRVSDAGAGYVLTSRFRAGYDGEEIEPNEHVPQLLADAPEVVVVGAIGWAGDRDRFWLPGGDAAGRYRIAVSGVPGVDLAIEISDRPGTVTDAIDSGGAGRPESGIIDIDPARYVGVPIVSVTSPTGDHSHLVYRLLIRRMDERMDDERAED